MKNIPLYVLVSRIFAVVCMSFAIALGIILLLAGYILQSFIAFAFFFPAIMIMAFLEKKADVNWRE
tara:strand:- start:1778 stop:1975 length:198 start_codon:yes stop_codon:yes gene_type:complete